MKKYDYLIVGAGLAGAVQAYAKGVREKASVVVLEKKNHIGGFCYDREEHGILVQRHGAHIFRTGRKDVWDFVNSICEFEPFINSPKALFRGKMYSLPFNMNTFYELFGVITPGDAEKAIANDCIHPVDGKPLNMEEFVLSKVGRRIYETLIKGYSEKQWGRPCLELPADTMAHLPMRMTFDNNYYNVPWQGIPKHGYTTFLESLMCCAELYLRADFITQREIWKNEAEHIIYTGRLDEYFDYCYGELEYRSVRFEHEWLPNCSNKQGVAVVNHTDVHPAYTRSIEHKHFLRSQVNIPGTVISYEYPSLPCKKAAPIYPVLDEKNLALRARYLELADKEENVTFFGQLAEFKPYAMSELIEKIL
jgi:UDP-galactopyranose mutase